MLEAKHNERIGNTMTYSEELLSFIHRSPSIYHVIENLRAGLLEQGYEELSEGERWQLSPGKGYFVRRNGSALLAFRLPAGTPRGFMMAAAHADSPTFKLKENAEKDSAGCVQLSTETYGGGNWGTWFDRPLSVAGRLLVREEGGIVTRLVNIERDLLVIPSVAIHMMRNLNDGWKILPHVDTLPLYGSEGGKSFNELLAETAGVRPEDILGRDLFLYARQKGAVLGAEEEFLLSPRLDDLECVWALMRGFLAASSSEDIPVCCIFDNEEVGSQTRQGAASTFLRDSLRRIAAALGCGDEGYLRLLSQSCLVSADNAQCRHPNHPEFADSLNFPLMNRGIVLKYNANQRYTTDGVSAALFRSLCAEAGVPVQLYANRSDLPGGSTLGSIANTHVPVPTADIGLAQLAMHSCCETAGVKDLGYLVDAMTLFFSKTLHAEEGAYRL